MPVGLWKGPGYMSTVICREKDYTLSKSRRWLINLQLDTETPLGVLGLRWFPLAFSFCFARRGFIEVGLSSSQVSTHNVTGPLLLINVKFPPRPSILTFSPGLRSAPSFEPSLIFFDCDNEGIRVFFSVSSKSSACFHNRQDNVMFKWASPVRIKSEHNFECSID